MSTTDAHLCDTVRTRENRVTTLSNTNSTPQSDPPPVYMQSPAANAAALNTTNGIYTVLAILAQVACLTTIGIVLLLLPVESWSDIPWARVATPPLAALYLLYIMIIAKTPCSRGIGDAALAESRRRRGIGIFGVLAWPMSAVATFLHSRHNCQQEQCLIADDNPNDNPIAVRNIFIQLHRLPDQVSFGFLFLFGAALNISMWMLCRRFDELQTNFWLLVGTVSMLVLPIGAFANSWVRTILVPTYERLGYFPTKLLKSNHHLLARVAAPSLLIAIGIVGLIACTGLLWGSELLKRDLKYNLRSEAQSLSGLIYQGRTTEIGRFLQKHPQYSLRISDQSYGKPVDFSTLSPGMSTSSSSPRTLTYVHHGPDITIVAKAEAPRLNSFWIMLSAAISGVVACFLSIVVSRNFARDIEATCSQFSSKLTNKSLRNLHRRIFSSHEINDLIQSLARFVGRVEEENSARKKIFEQFQESERQKSKFLANMSHDLRSPLNSILGFSELLTSGSEGKLSPSQLSMVTTIQSGGRELLQQIDDILDLAKIEAGRFELARESTPVVAIISRAIGNARRRSKLSIEYESEIEPGLAPAKVDPRRAAQALENSIIFVSSQMHGGVIRIHIKRKNISNGSMTAISIIARGCFHDIPTLNQTIERGFAEIGSAQGLGLELPLASRIVQLHGGNFTIENDQLGIIIRLEFPDQVEDNPNLASAS